MIHEWNEDFGGSFAKKKQFPEELGREEFGGLGSNRNTFKDFGGVATLCEQNIEYFGNDRLKFKYFEGTCLSLVIMLSHLQLIFSECMNLWI